MKQAIVAAMVLVGMVYLKICIPTFGTEFIPLLRGWLDLEQVAVPMAAVSWLLW